MKDQLINLYGRGEVDDIEARADFSDLCQAYGHLQGFEQEKNYVRGLRRQLQELMYDQRPQAQVKLCLKLLYKTEPSTTRQDYLQLIKLAYRQHWISAQQLHFDDTYAVIEGDVYYFLSFTKHNMTPGYVNIVNRNYRHLIEDVFYKKPEDFGDYKEDNLLAKAVWYFLTSHGLKGFYYPLHEGDSRNVRKVLSEKLNSTLVFVQLMHVAIFEKDPESNYCFFEFDNVLRSKLCKKRIYILAQCRDELENTLLRHEPFEAWRYQAIEIAGALELKYSEYYDDGVIRHNMKEIREKIVKKIEAARLEMFEQIPS